MTRSIAVIATDPHCGSSIGLCNPRTKVPSLVDRIYRQVELTATQKLLWEYQKEDLHFIKELAHGDPVHLFVTGDITQGLRFVVELMSTSLAAQIFIAAGVLYEYLSLPNVKTLRIATGTPVHNFSEATAETLVCEQLRPYFSGVDMAVTDHGSVNIAGKSIDYAHHGSAAGSRDWLKGNVAALYARSIQQRAFKEGERPPDLILRGHVHEPVMAAVFDFVRCVQYETQIAIIPPLCLAGEHAIKVAQSPGASYTGMLVLEIIDGVIKPHWRLHTWDLIRREIF